MPVSFPAGAEYLRILPEIILTLAGVLIMFLEAMWSDQRRTIFGPISIAALAAALWAAMVSSSGPAFSNLLIIGDFATFFRMLVIVVGLLAILASSEYLARERASGAEYYALILFSIVGQCVMVTANDLLMVFIGLEISSIASYVLAGYLRDDPRNNEAALKYFLLGSFATAFLLYGVAWTYGLTGSTNLSTIRQVLLSTGAPSLGLTGVAAALIFAGLAFKISAAPFHIWVPDVYQGAPAPVSAFLSAGPKAAAFAVLVVFMVSFGSTAAQLQPVLWACALATMVVGNFAAIQQSNIKRMLAYSSIAHAGYVLVAVTANSEIGSAAVMFYMAAYALTNIGAFAVVTHVARKGERFVSIGDFAGLSRRQPALAAMLAIFLLSLIGVPLTGGFFGKFYIFKAALDSHLVWLTVLGLLNSAVAAYYYLRVLVLMYFNEPGEAAEELPAAGAGLQIAVYACAVGTLVLGIMPDWVLDFASKAALK